jgi:MFS family permease
MINRWGVLGLLFIVRTTMAFQFESVAAIGTILERDFHAGFGEIGVLIGLYLLPGVVIALPGGAIGRALGDKRTVLIGCAIMLGGNLLMAFANAWSAQIVGRLLTGVGGVLLNVITSKMVTDWFGEREMATAMALFVNSWPFGIAIALLCLPPLGVAEGYVAVFLLAAGLVAAGALLVAIFYKDAIAPSPGPRAFTTLDRRATLLVTIAGLIWGLFNTAFAMVFSFGMSVLMGRAWSIESSSSAVSLMLWLTIFSVPLGGFLADRIGRKGLLIVASTLVAAALMLAISRAPDPLLILVCLGLVSGLPAGAMMALPASVLGPPNRAVGMALFFTLFYLAMAIGPALAGLIASYAGRASAALDFGAFLLAVCPLLLLAFRAASGREEVAALCARPGYIVSKSTAMEDVDGRN